MISVISCLLFYVDFCRGITVISTKFLLDISFSPPLPPPFPLLSPLPFRFPILEAPKVVFLNTCYGAAPVRCSFRKFKQISLSMFSYARTVAKFKCLCFIINIPGFMADKFGNYFAAFLMAGGVAIVASLIPFLLICVKQEQKKNFDDDVEETVHPGQLEGVDDTGLESKGGSQDSISTIGRDRLIRSSSFAIALDSPIF